MADNRKKASMSQVLTDIKPYITKSLWRLPVLRSKTFRLFVNSPAQVQNVQLMQGLTNNKPDSEFR